VVLLLQCVKHGKKSKIEVSLVLISIHCAVECRHFGNMVMNPGHRLLAVAGSIFLAACVPSQEAVRKDVVEASADIRKGPVAAPAKSITNFDGALRCMDTQFLIFGVRDVSMLVEDLQDSTKKVSAGTKDMLISAVSDMTRRSRAVRLIAYGQDSGNVIGFLREAERKNAFKTVPDFGIRGSISQLDENIAKKSGEAGVQLAGIGAGKAVMASTSILGLDLTVIRTEDLSILPGVTSRNSVAISREGSGTDAEVAYKKFGVNYSMNLSKSEGTAQALRNLVELSVIELLGKLAKVPYWTCLGADARDETVRAEISDWYDSLYGNSPELVTYFQMQLRVRGLYAGEIDGEPDPDLRDAVSAYREALGLSRAPLLDREFFTAYLAANHAEVTPRAKRLFDQLVAQRAPPAREPVDRPGNRLAVSIYAVGNQGAYRRGEEINLAARPSADAFLYCYMQDETGAVQRFFPNGVVRDPYVKADKGLAIPGAMRFKMLASSKGSQEKVACLGSPREILSQLPNTVVGTDFETLPVRSLDQVAAAFEKVLGGAVAMGVFNVDVR
jgi:curli biogenesis system outer membrane secretion channel CsgG